MIFYSGLTAKKTNKQKIKHNVKDLFVTKLTLCSIYRC